MIGSAKVTRADGTIERVVAEVSVRDDGTLVMRYEESIEPLRNGDSIELPPITVTMP